MTGQPVQLTPQSITRRDPPSVSPDGKWIAFWQGGSAKNGLAAMPAGGGPPRVVTTRRGHGQIMWLGPEDLVFQETLDDSAEKILLAAPSQAQEKWRPSGFPYAWSPNGKFLLYDQFPGGISVLELASGKTWPGPGAHDTAFHEWGLATWSPDGAFLVINRYRIQ